MGRPKLTLPWGETTVIGRVVSVLAQAGVADLRVVTGGAVTQVEKALQSLRLPQGVALQAIHNPAYLQGEMLSSCQAGLASLQRRCEAALVVLGDQPQIEVGVVQAVMQAYRTSGAALVVPSYQMRRGHPWFLDRQLWPAVLALQAPQTLRDFLHTHADRIQYVAVESASILQDLDTPEDYRRYGPPVRDPK
jgi:molybdenum cofactor cytidylyltransferase